ncbi:MAG: lamin tail domain-containing protein, partial [Planctomycetota bacterium]
MFSNRLFRTLFAGAAILCAAQAASAQVKISQVYGSGGNSQSMLFSDYIEIYNAGAAGQDLTGWSTQYASSTGTTWSVTALPSVILNPGQYLLIQQGTGGSLPAGTVPANPAAQATGTIAVSGTDAKIALVASTTALTGGTPLFTTSANLRDFVGIGTANWNESAAAGLGTYAAANNCPAMATGYAVFRRLGGAADTNVNRADWAVGYPAPRNSASALGTGLAGSGTAFPLTLEETQTVRLLVTPYDVATLRASAGLTVTADISGIGGSATAALVDDGTSGDDLAGDGIFTLETTVAVGTVAGTKNMPVSFADA